MYYNYWGMNMIWWFVWGILLFWIFVTPYNIPGQRNKKDSALDILQKRFASGQINNQQYNQMKQILLTDVPK
ncbi:MAG: SHOCT domain-containing protein [Parafilimonas sp.]